ncbi:FtsH protease activity modulator HflK [Pusillimonas minor]|uniref:Protein HflK n=1 Tax=Pusillimonas minor TaxID=2697024 RepID=A0A842HPN2_9BURK|nr:FtsH protease activity modulator HflK [Pusillimonas minor]MBC2770277.1 FtsH protease activity modulator HflK [Pusillimonas minor]
MRLMSKIFNLNDPGWGRGKGGNEPPRQPDNNQGNNSGPPDLDEVWRDFNNRVGSLFGRKGRRGGGGGHQGGGGSPVQLPKGSPKLVVGGLVVLVGLWLASGFVVVQEGQVAVVTKFGKYVKTLNPGLQWHLPYPIEDHQTVNISQLRTFEVGFRGSARNKVLAESLMLTTDENIVDVQYVVQYRLMPNGAPDYLFKTSDPDESVRQAAETAMRDVVGRQPMDSVLYSARTQIAADVQRLAQEILDRYQTGIQVSTVAIQNVQPPEQVQAAFDDAVKAGQDRERQINEGNAYASRVLPEAQGQAARLVQEAEGYRVSVVSRAEGDSARFSSIEAEYAKAPDVTRERMYLSTMQSILEKSSKVFIDSESSNNMLYLPLDKIMQQAARNPDAATQSASASSAPTPAAADKSASNAPGAARSGSSNPYSGGSSGSLMTSPYSR